MPASPFTYTKLKCKKGSTLVKSRCECKTPKKRKSSKKKTKVKTTTKTSSKKKKISSSSDAKKKARAKTMIKDVYTMWKTISKAGLAVHGHEFYYMEHPKNWRVTLEMDLSDKNYKHIETMWKQTKDDYKEAKRDLKDYNKKNK